MPQELNVADLRLRSSAFKHHEKIPARHTRDGDDVSPELEWSGVPEGAKSFAVVVHDPDAPLVDGFTHWVAYGIAGDQTGVPEGDDGATAGTHSFRDTADGGPAPPPRPWHAPLLLLGLRARRRPRPRARARPSRAARADRGSRHRAGPAG